MTEYCINPFETAKIYPDGSVYCCGVFNLMHYSFGNIYEQSFSEIWNGQKAQNFRKQFIEQNYQYCNFEYCRSKKTAELNASIQKQINEGSVPYPKKVQIINNDIFLTEKYEDNIIDALKNAQFAGIYSRRDIFENKTMENLIKKIIKFYPEIKFFIGSSGVNTDEKHLKKYGLGNNLSGVVIIPEKNNLKNDNLKIIQNLKFLNKLKQENKIKKYYINLKVKGENPEIEKFADKNTIKINYAVSEKNICTAPFIHFDIRSDGNVYTCCPEEINGFSIGNILENSLTEIWNGEKARELRQKMLAGDYSICNLDICMQKNTASSLIITDKLPNPVYITLAYDRECNLHCLTCRDEQYRNSKEQTEIYNERIYTKLLPILKDAKEISISCSGEAFFSTHSRKLIKIVSKENTKAYWNIYTNGVLFNASNAKKLGIYSRIANAVISLPALDKKIYNKIMRGSDYDTVMKNIKETAYEFNYKKTIKNVILRTVISSLNYKEIPKIAKFAQENNFELQITRFRDWGSDLGRDYKTVSVWDKNHPEYKNFQKILKHKSLNYNAVDLEPSFMEIRKSDV